jgi:hypothetical protein
MRARIVGKLRLRQQFVDRLGFLAQPCRGDARARRRRWRRQFGGKDFGHDGNSKRDRPLYGLRTAQPMTRGRNRARRRAILAALAARPYDSRIAVP